MTADIYGKGVCTTCGTTVDGCLNGVTGCPKCGGEMKLTRRGE